MIYLACVEKRDVCMPVAKNDCDLLIKTIEIKRSATNTFTAVTQNLFWYSLFGQRNGGNWFKRIQAYKPYHLFGFQECDNIEHVRDRMDLKRYRYVVFPHAVTPQLVRK